jgi:formylglycine-generating enzyme required for sulfatase activity
MSRRYPSARALHDEIQLYIEGVKERQRRHDLAETTVKAGRATTQEYMEFRAQLAKAERDAVRLQGEYHGWEPIDKKRILWSAQDDLRAMKRRLLDLYSAANAAFTNALSAEPGNRSARAAKAELFLQKFIESEEAGDEDQMHMHEALVRQYGDKPVIDALRGDGTLRIATTVYPCDCLKSGLMLTGTSSDFGEFGPYRMHSRNCVPVEFPGADVWLFRYVERDRMLVPSRPEGALLSGGAQFPPHRGMPPVQELPGNDALYVGRTPIGPLTLPMGSYLCVIAAEGLAAARVPVHMTRDRNESVSVTLYPAGDVPPGFVHVPAGTFVYGNDPLVLQPEKYMHDASNYFMGVFPVTCAEYLEFLNAVAAEDPSEAARWTPMQSGKQSWKRGLDGRYAIPAADEKIFPGPMGPEAWDERRPMTCVSWEKAMAYCMWKTRTSGTLVMLPTEIEWEKSARGTDGRFLPWGDHFDPLFSNSMNTREGGAQFLPVGEIPTDCSPYGVRDTAGNVRELCLNTIQAGYGHLRATRGGACLQTEHYCHCAYRSAVATDVHHQLTGFRVLIIPSEHQLDLRKKQYGS